MDLNLLNQPLTVVDDPGLQTTDPRLEEVSLLVQQAQYLEAAAQAESILSAGIYDIRLIGFFVYGVFLEKGIGNLEEIFDCLSGLLRDNWSAVGPAAKREKHAQASLRWFSNQLLKKLQYEESIKGDLWERWVSETTSDEVEEVLNAADGFRRALSMVLEDGAAPIIDNLSKLVQWLQAFEQIIYREAEPEPEAEPVQMDEEEVGTPSGQKAVASMHQVSVRSPVSGEGTSVEGSYHLGVLMNKMEAFERLIVEEKYPKAALVADDINEIIAGFDPRLYFPKLFARFAFLQATNVQELIAFDEQKETAEWQAMKDFYKVDLNGFVDS